MPRDPLTLDALLVELRARGVAVAVRDVARLRDAFAAQPAVGAGEPGAGKHGSGVEVGERELCALLRCTLAKSNDQRRQFDGAFEAWVREARATLDTGQGEDGGTSTETPPRSPKAATLAVERAIRAHLETDAERATKTRRHIAAGAAATVLLALTFVWLFGQPAPKQETARLDPPPTVRPRPPEPVAPTTPSPLAPEILREVQVPILKVENTIELPPTPSTAQLLGLATLALGVGAVTFLTFRKRARRTIVAIDPAAARAYRAPMPHVVPAAEELLEAAAARAMVYGVDRFVADEPSERIDIARTVDASARAALPVIVHERPRFDRAVWIWRDTQPADSESVRISCEVARRLSRAGIEVRLATFYGTPEALAWDDDGSTFTPGAVDGHRDATILLLLTDGRGLDTALRDNLRQGVLRQALLGLRAWPRLAMVCFGDEHAPATAVARKFGLRAIQPDALPRFLADREVLLDRDTTPRAPQPLHGELHFWAAALALTAQPFDAEVAYHLRRALELRCPAWNLDSLLAVAEPIGTRFRWRSADNREQPSRLDLLDWLGKAEQHRAGAAFVVLGDTKLARALAFWRAEIDAQRRPLASGPIDENPEDAQTRRDRLGALDLEQALLSLFDDPARALEDLSVLAAGPLRDAVRLRLRDFVPVDRERTEASARLPWHSTQDVEPTTLEALVDLGLGEGLLERRPPRLTWLVLVVIMTCVTVAVAATLWRGVSSIIGTTERPARWIEPPALPRSFDVRWETAWELLKDGKLVETALERVQRVRRVVLQAPKHRAPALRLATNSLTELGVGWTSVANPEIMSDSTRIWRAGRHATTKRPSQDPWPVVNVLWVNDRTPDDLTRWEMRVCALLDGGVFDSAVLSCSWPNLVAWPEPHPSTGLTWQLVVVAAAGGLDGIEFDADHLAVAQAHTPEDLPTPGTTPVDVAKAWPAVSIKQFRGEPRLAASSSGLELIAIPAGTFRLGSPGGEAERLSNEGPIDNVAVDPFAISRFEVTRQVWRSVMAREPEAWKSDQPNDDDLPANDVSWFDALEFCNALSLAEDLPECYELTREGDQVIDAKWTRSASGYRLPTEAEWEYAARAGTTTPYPWTEGEAGLDAHAWWAKNSGKDSDQQVHAVGGKLANAWGLHDVIGNVWEWCWDEPPEAVSSPPDPAGRDGNPRAGVARVLRGGSFIVFLPRVLRSAYRYWYVPSFSVESYGFRCVRGPHPQHPSNR